MKIDKGLVVMTHQEYEYMEENHEGLCMHCGEVVDMIHPDDSKEACTVCGRFSVYGVAKLKVEFNDEGTSTS